ncbi:hypothetical protein [Candidatus Tisiphia endosymbiont of Parasteatoda lunata]|uniref:hypothetical protein n=1 Tax=Candidatus Tisiphia endosymbiont of Parasteatoda lunata TaxID=3066275 RepID=UPI00313EBB18
MGNKISEKFVLKNQSSFVWQEGGGAEIYGVLLEMAAECSSLNLDDTRARILEITYSK